MASNYMEAPLLIRAGSTISSSHSLGGETIIGFRFPIGFEGSQITMKASVVTNNEFFSVNDPTTGAALTVKAGSGGAIVPISSFDLACVQNIQIISDTAVAVDRTVYVIARRMM